MKIPGGRNVGVVLNKRRLSDYEYHLPEDLIAQKPLETRDQSRMLVLKRAEAAIEHSVFNRLPDYLKQGDLLVFNDTRVIPARLIGRIAGRNTPAEILLLHKNEGGKWVAMVKPGKKLKPGARVQLDRKVEALVEDYAERELRLISFVSPRPIEELLPELGKVPLPPYIKRDVDYPEQYQTIYAQKAGSAAAPTAGFHFTDRVFQALADKGVETAFITLHIGPGTFQPVKAEDIREHKMHSEFYRIDNQTATTINRARREGRRVIAVGTTVCRVLETVAAEDGLVSGREGWTDLYIYPGFKFRLVGAMLTNFHLPRSTLLMLISAFGGYDLVMKAYRQAVAEEYRFYSFGDCMLIL